MAIGAVGIVTSARDFAGSAAHQPSGFGEIGRRHEAQVIVGRLWDIVSVFCA
jgi:hypothetical protein